MSVVGMSPSKMGFDVLDIFGFLIVDITGEIQVIIVFLDFGDRHHATVFLHLDLFIEHVHNSVDVLLAEAVLVPVFNKALRGVDHENAFAAFGIFFVKHNDAGWNASAVEQIGGQADDPFYITPADYVFPDLSLGVATEQHAVRENNRSFPLLFNE